MSPNTQIKTVLVTSANDLETAFIFFVIVTAIETDMAIVKTYKIHIPSNRLF